MSELSLEGVTKTFPSGVTAVRDLTLRVADGEMLVLVGPSGCGKTTTLRLVAGLDEPSAGTIYLDGKVVNTVPPRERNLAFVFQRPALYPHLNVRENLDFGLRLGRRVAWWARFLPFAQPSVPARDAERIAAVAELLGLTGLLSRRPSELSGGEQQRVALGRALARQPGLLLLDEPLSNLDARLRIEMRRELHLLRRRLGATMLYVTHDQDEALNLGDRIAVIDRGVLQQADCASVLLERPVNRFVAGFLGSPPMNLVDGTLVAADGNLAFAAPSGKWSIPNPRPQWLAWSSRSVTLGIRPDQVKLRPPKAGTGPVFEVRSVEFWASGRLAILEHDGWRWTALTSRDDAPAEGQRLTALPDWDRVCLFDTATGQAISHGGPAG